MSLSGFKDLLFSDGDKNYYYVLTFLKHQQIPVCVCVRACMRGKRGTNYTFYQLKYKSFNYTQSLT